jgi:hypothetical protein
MTRRASSSAWRALGEHYLGAALVTALVPAALGACATASGPSAASIAIDVRSGSAESLRGARTVWVAGAVSRTGTLASGASATGPAPSGDDAEVRDTVVEAVRGQRGLELAAARDRADLVLYFEQADRLRCWGCRQPENLWHWWGLVLDPAGRELASLHGETAAGPAAAARQFVESVKAMTHRSRHGG